MQPIHKALVMGDHNRTGGTRQRLEWAVSEDRRNLSNLMGGEKGDREEKKGTFSFLRCHATVSELGCQAKTELGDEQMDKGVRVNKVVKSFVDSSCPAVVGAVVMGGRFVFSIREPSITS